MSNEEFNQNVESSAKFNRQSSAPDTVGESSIISQETAANQIRGQLRLVLEKIGEVITQYRTEQKEKEEQREPIPNLEGQYPLNQKLNYYRDQSNNIKYKLEHVYNISRIKDIESQIKKKKEIIKQMSNDNNILENINKKQTKGIEEFQNIHQNKKEIDAYTAKIKKIKEELKKGKEDLKSIEVQLKDQSTQISSLEEKCDLIKDNIEYKKKQQMKEVEDFDKTNKVNDIYVLDEQKCNLENQINFEEKNYKINISNQNDMIDQLNQEIDIIKAKLKHIEQSKRINALRQKEINKINRKRNTAHGNRLIKNQPARPELKPKPKSRGNSRVGAYRNGIRPPYTEDFTSKTPNFKVNPKMQRPFEINKFRNGTGYSNRLPNYDTNEKLSQPNDGGYSKRGKEVDHDMLNQIEDLSKFVYLKNFRERNSKSIESRWS